jgi:hypothetical protein
MLRPIADASVLFWLFPSISPSLRQAPLGIAVILLSPSGARSLQVIQTEPFEVAK